LHPITDFVPHLPTSLPETFALLQSANLLQHPAVQRVTLHGSRGLAGGFRPDSDIDLSLLVEMPEELDLRLLDEVIKTTLEGWQASVEIDLAAIFAIHPCGLACFEVATWTEGVCPCSGGLGCFGLYKIQKGFHGLVENAGIEVKHMYPCLKIWQRV